LNRLKIGTQRWLSILIIITLIFSWFPTATFAEDIHNEAEHTNEELEQNDYVDAKEISEEYKEKQLEVNSEMNNIEFEEDDDVVNDNDEQKTDNANVKEQTDENNESELTANNVDDSEEEKEDSIDREEEIKSIVKQSIEKTKDYYKNNPPLYDNGNKGSHSDYWVYSALWGAGFKDLRNDFPWESDDVSPWAEHTYWSKGRDSKTGTSNMDAGIIIGSVLLGKNPYEFGKRNIVEDLIAKQKENGSFFNIWGESWAMIALDLMSAKYDQEKHIEYILSQQNDKGYFGGADSTGWILIALAPHMDRPDVKQAVDKSIQGILENRDKATGEVMGQMGGPNSNSVSPIIMGLAAVGEDLYSEKWTMETTENGHVNLVESFIDRYQLENGGFKWKSQDDKANPMATEQALLALATVEQGGSIFEQMKSEIDIPAKPKPSSELSKLIIDQGIGEIVSNESPQRYYLGADVDKISITPIVENKNAVIEFGGVELENGEPYEFDLKEGGNLKVLTTHDEEGKQASRIVYNFYRAFSYSPTKVTEYLPAPGQFVNQDSWGSNPKGIIYDQNGVSLGAFGGYVIFEFDEPIKNDPNNPYGVDLIIYGNAFKGNEEPGGVQVMSENDDTWYDIAGSEHYEDETIVDYEVTYTNPDPEFIEGAVDIPWKDNQGESGEVKTNRSHTQPYFPNPENYNRDSFKYSGEQLTFSGVRLKEKKPAFGYVDVHPNDPKQPTNPSGRGNNKATNPYMDKQAGAPIDIEWAVDENGQPANIDDIKYVKVYTSMLRDGGAIGEISTEVTKVARTKTEENIGETADLEAIKLQTEDSEIAVKLKTGEYVYDVNVDADSVKVLAEGNAENLYINNEKLEMGTASKSINLDENESKTIRVIAQNEKDNPKIYYLNIKNDEEAGAPKVNKAALEKLIQEAKDIDLDKITDETGEDLQAALAEAEDVFANAKATQNEVDHVANALEKAISNIKERAPPVTVNVRVETHEKTLVPTTEVTVAPFDLMEYINDNNDGKSLIKDSPKAVHAIIRALETVEGLDLKDDEQFGLSSGGNYIESIGKIGAFTAGSNSGWMYFVNNDFAPVGIADYKLEDGDSIVLYFTENYMDSTFSWFDSESYTAKMGEELEVKLNGNGSVEGASILIDEEAYVFDGETVFTDEGGKVKLVFDKPGTYHLSANRLNEAGERNIVRPYAIVKVTEDDADKDGEEKDTEPPIITVEGIKDGQKVVNDTVSFTVKAEDKVDGIVDATVTLNKDTVNPNNTGKYIIELNKGKNTIIVEATDKSGNSTTKEFTVTYEPIESDYDINSAIDITIEYILKQGVSSDWEAIGISKAGKSVPASYLSILSKNIDKEITDGLKNGQFLITDAERLAIAALATGKDPKNIKGHNLIELIYNSPERTLWDNTVVDTMTYQGNNALAFALVAMDSNKYEIPKDAKWSRQAIIDQLLKTQLDDGSWSLNETHPDSSVDVTAMVITGLTPYKHQSEVEQALDKAVNYLSKAQNSEGGFDGGESVGGVTSEATAQVIIGLTTYGIDPTSKQFTKNGHNLIEHLLSYQNKDGGFSHTHDYTDSDDIATEQALQALVAYQLFLNGDGGLYYFDNDDKEELPTIEIPLDKKEPVPVSKGEKVEIKNTKSKVILPNELPDGTKLTVTVPSKEKAPSEDEKLELAGDWFDFQFEFEGTESHKGIYELTLGVKDGVDFEKANIYYFNETKQVWELKEGVKDPVDRTITIFVNHFSMYGVFIKSDEIDDSNDNGIPGKEDPDKKDPSKENPDKEDPSKENPDKKDPSIENPPKENPGKENISGGISSTEDHLNKEKRSKEDKVDIDDESSKGDKILPKTATNLFNLMLLGFVLLVIGGTIVWIRRENKVKNI